MRHPAGCYQANNARRYRTAQGAHRRDRCFTRCVARATHRARVGRTGATSFVIHWCVAPPTNEARAPAYARTRASAAGAAPLLNRCWHRILFSGVAELELVASAIVNLPE